MAACGRCRPRRERGQADADLPVRGGSRALPGHWPRPFLPLFLLLAMAACGGDSVEVRGRVPAAATDRISHVWVVGVPGRTALTDGRFRLRDVAPGVIDLRFGDEDTEVARMELRNVPAGAALDLGEVWVDADTDAAFPGRLALDGARVIEVNGLRVSPPGMVPREVDVAAVVLAVAGQGDALLARPAGQELPDLRVVVTPGTRVQSARGRPALLERLEFGDSVRLRGVGEGGYVVAIEVQTPRGAEEFSDSRERGPARPEALPRAEDLLDWLRRVLEGGG